MKKAYTETVKVDFMFVISSKALNFLSLFSFILRFIFLGGIVRVRHFYSCFRRSSQTMCHLLLDACKGCALGKNEGTKVSTAERSGDKQYEKEKLLAKGDVEIVMGRLGILHDENDKLTAREILSVFYEDEASLTEVKEAFGVFDENRDGFIDAKELQKVLHSIGLVEYSDKECQKMILAFDDNGDGLIDIDEFSKLMEESSLSYKQFV